MPTHTELATRLLRDAAQFFRSLGAQNEPLQSQMEQNATVYDQVANLLEQDPTGAIQDDK